MNDRKLKQTDIFKHRKRNQKGGCTVCGKTNGYGDLFEYHVKHAINDIFGAGDVIIDGLFCSIKCLNTKY